MTGRSERCTSPTNNGTASKQTASSLFATPADRLDLTEDWYACRDQAYEDLAVQWLKAHDVPYVRDEEMTNGREGTASGER